MNSNGILRKHWFHVAMHFASDVALFLCSFLTGAFLRFGEEADAKLLEQWPAMLLGGVVFACLTYILGLYSTHSTRHGIFKRTVLLAGCMVLAALVVLGAGWSITATTLGRGVLAMSTGLGYVAILLHHAAILHYLCTVRERVAYIVTSPFDEAETRLVRSFTSRNIDFIGVIPALGYQPVGQARSLGSMEELEAIVRRERIDRVLCTSKSLTNSTLTRHFCKLRYSGVTVMPLILLCEELEQYVPLELVSPEWLLNASGEPHLFYIKKVKRLFDIVASSAGLVLSAPLLALAALVVRLTSRGPVLYRQVRAGRFGRTFEMLKIRSMCMDAEADGVQWSGKNDPRVTLVGRFMRKYRIDEIPQLWNVLCGHMSFVGPRPERPEMIGQLAKDIPSYEERLMVQPGITGWAQVCFPYGASVGDSRRKLEYDLYYMKHMSVFLDVFIMLDTVRIVLTGGVTHVKERAPIEPEAMEEWRRLHPDDSTSGRVLNLETVRS